MPAMQIGLLQNELSQLMSSLSTQEEIGVEIRKNHPQRQLPSPRSMPILDINERPLSQGLHDQRTQTVTVE